MVKKKTTSIKKTTKTKRRTMPTKTTNAPTINNTVKIGEKEVDCKKYFEYYTLIIFFLFSILFISIIIISFLAIFGIKYLWYVIPIILGFWIVSYYLSKRIFKKYKY